MLVVESSAHAADDGPWMRTREKSAKKTADAVDWIKLERVVAPNLDFFGSDSAVHDDDATMAAMATIGNVRENIMMYDVRFRKRN